METVSWELKEGVRSFRSLVDMIGEALRLHDIAIHQKSGAWNYYGYYVAEGGMFVGFYLDEPTVVVVETTRQTTKADDFEPEVGQFENGKWTNSVELSSESVHFFSRSRASQMQFLEAWIGDSVDFGQKVLG